MLFGSVRIQPHEEAANNGFVGGTKSEFLCEIMTMVIFGSVYLSLKFCHSGYLTLSRRLTI